MKYSFNQRALAADIYDHGGSWSKLAQAAGVSRPTIGDIARLEQTPTVQMYLRICAALNVPPTHWDSVAADALEPGLYELDLVAMHKATRGRSPVANGTRAAWNKQQVKKTYIDTLMRVCYIADVPPVEFFTAAPPPATP